MLDMKLTLDGILTIIVGLGAIMVAYRQLKASADAQKSIFFKDLYSTMFENEQIKTAFYMLERNKFTYNVTGTDKFHGSEIEKQIDFLLGFFVTVCELHKNKMLSSKEMTVFDYRLKRVYDNKELQKYLKDLDLFYDTNNIDMRAFQAFRNYCETKFNTR